jgi:uncharacterized membrane protein YeaQ/YmgE (transglycosylase-associated protein family)
MNLLSWLIFGLIVGIVAHMVDPAPDGGGIVGTLILGVLGALVGGFLANLVFGVGISGFNFTSFIVAVLGSLLLLFIQRAVRRSDV